MENYEQKYKEAIERAKKKINSGEGVAAPPDYTVCEVIFPELKEPEDERIRKGLIKGLSAMRDIHKHQTFSDDAINIDDAIAWLEKQGETSPVLSNSSNIGKDAWSEEDEKKIMWLVRLISTGGFRELDSDKMPCSRSELLDCLKSLKPRWKPSEEQLKTLWDAIVYVEGCYSNFRGGRVLELLYNELKQL